MMDLTFLTMLLVLLFVMGLRSFVLNSINKQCLLIPVTFLCWWWLVMPAFPVT